MTTPDKPTSILTKVFMDGHREGERSVKELSGYELEAQYDAGRFAGRDEIEATLWGVRFRWLTGGVVIGYLLFWRLFT